MTRISEWVVGLGNRRREGTRAAGCGVGDRDYCQQHRSSSDSMHKQFGIDVSQHRLGDGEEHPKDLRERDGTFDFSEDSKLAERTNGPGTPPGLCPSSPEDKRLDAPRQIDTLLGAMARDQMQFRRPAAASPAGYLAGWRFVERPELLLPKIRTSFKRKPGA